MAVRDLGGEAWVTFPVANPRPGLARVSAAEGGVVPDALVEVETLGAVKAFVEAGRGLALLPRGAMAVEEQAGAPAQNRPRRRPDPADGTGLR